MSPADGAQGGDSAADVVQVVSSELQEVLGVLALLQRDADRANREEEAAALRLAARVLDRAWDRLQDLDLGDA